MQNRFVDFIVGLFLLAGLIGLVVLAFQVSGLTRTPASEYYTVTAGFDNIGSLKVRSSVQVAGVRVGQVQSITLDNKTFRAKVVLVIQNKTNQLPRDSSASIMTEGILGANYISLTPGFDMDSLKDGDRIETTHSALILENLVGQLLYSFQGGNDKDKKDPKKKNDH